MKSATVEAPGKINTENNLYRDSIQATKQSIARETLDAFYHDALDYYNDYRYDEALQLLDKIYSIDPHYQDVAKLRVTIRKTQQSTMAEHTMDSVRIWMGKADEAVRAGQKVLAVSYWNEALKVNPDYAPAKKKIQDVNEALAKKEFENGYLHYHRGELEDALESWSNASALDPTYKQRGLLLLMSKVERQVRRNQTQRLAAQGFEQYQAGQWMDALLSYEELMQFEPRNEEARRMAAKIRIQLGQAALKSARDALAAGTYKEAIQQADQAIHYGYEISRSNAIKQEAQHAIELANRPKIVHKKEPAVVASTTMANSTGTATMAMPTQPANPEEAMVHYRQGMGAIRKKDFHLALDELEIASQLDPSNERIYMARERARQEWSAASAHGPTSNP
jgi:tetratricopeptide (TPR) repeat protein